MKRVQITFTDSEGKAFIARAALRHPRIRSCLDSSKVLLIGGTTVSAFSEALGFGPMRISGRIHASGTRTSGSGTSSVPHSLLVAGGKAENADAAILQIASELIRDDLIVTGANAMDAKGEALLAFAAPEGGERGRALRVADEHGVPAVILCGMNKLIPDAEAALAAADRSGTALSMGAAVSLYRVRGTIIDEIQAFKILFGLEAAVIAGSGMESGAGTRTYTLQGESGPVNAAWELARSLKSVPLSGDPASLKMCSSGSPSCARHVACVYSAQAG